MAIEYVFDLAKQMQIPLTSVTIVDDSSTKNLDGRLLKLSSGRHTSFVLLQQKDWDGFNPDESNLLKMKVQTALERLQIQLAP